MANMRGKQTVRDMVLSMALIGLLAGVIYLFIPHDESLDPVREVSYRAEVATARRAAPYPLAAPVGLSEEWRATSVRYQAQSELGSAWHLGFIGPEQEYAAVEQSDGTADAFIRKVTHDARPTHRTQRVGGKEWVRYEGPKYDALVLEEPGATTVVTGTASFGQLGTLAAALEARNGQGA